MELKKIASKTVAVSLVGISVITPVMNTSYAMENTNENNIEMTKGDLKVKVIEDTEEKKVVEVVDGNETSISTFNKKDNTLALEVKKDGKVIQNNSIDIDNQSETDNSIESKEARATESLKCIHSKLKYSINMKSWTITNSKGSVKKRPETSSHKDYLYRFRDAVKASRRGENLADASMGVAKVSAIYGVVTAASGVGAVVAAVTASGGAVSAAYNLWDSIVEKREADRYFAIL